MTKFGVNNTLKKSVIDANNEIPASTSKNGKLGFSILAFASIYVFACTCILLGVFLFLTCSTFRDLSSDEFEKTRKWDYFLFSQLWPPASCISPKAQHCEIPSGVNFWTIHGLWPSKLNSSHDPEFCNKSWIFNLREIQPIRNEMNRKWPNCYDQEPVVTFWKHEWEKHGTCAAAVPLVGSQLKYFSKALNLHATYNLTWMMDEAGYIPNEGKKIPKADLSSKLQHSVGKNVTLRCVWRKKVVTPLLWSVYICFDKNFNLIDCDSSETNCDQDSVLYWPFPNATSDPLR